MYWKSEVIFPSANQNMNTAETQISLWLHSKQQFSNSGDMYSILQFVLIFLCSGGLSCSEILPLRRTLLPWLHWLSRLQFWRVTAVHSVRVQSVSEQFCPVGFIGSFLPYVWWSSEVLFRKLLLVFGKFSSDTQSCLTLCNPMDCSTPDLPVHHQFLEFTQTHVHWVGDAIQPSHPLLSPSPPAFNLSQHQGLFKWVCSSHQVTKVLNFQLHHQSF